MPGHCRCTYLVVIERDRELADDLRELAEYLSTLSVAGCDVVIVDGSPGPELERNQCILRWVGRHVAAQPKHRSFSGAIDVIRAALDVSSCDRIVVAERNVRYDAAAIDRVCELLDSHEVVEPQDYFEPQPWWSGIEAGRTLVHRGIDAAPDHAATFGIRTSYLRSLRGVDLAWSNGDDTVRRVSSLGAEVYSADDVFVRRLPPTLTDWLCERPKQAEDDFDMPVKTMFFFALLPLMVLLAIFGGVGLAGGAVGAMAFASIGLAIRGRGKATELSPIRACLCAPLWLLERSVSVYWALFRKLRGSPAEVIRPSVAEAGSGARAASGE